MKNIPVIKEERGIPTLFVNGEPFFAMGGEIHNSSAGSLKFLKDNVWPRLRGMNMNTVIVPIYWETVEPEEGRYEYELLDGLVAQAREQGLHLILLWFGLWKNGESSYVPAWMKQDSRTYFRVKKVGGEVINTISPFCEAAVMKDAKAFAKVMARLRKTDAEESTVIMMQVENEIGLLGTALDYGQESREAFEGEIPEKIASVYGVGGTWKEAFGWNAEEYFMAYHFAGAVETITSMGQKEYPIPCYTNAWLRQYPWYAGSYPSGGPVREVHKIWKCTAPSLFALAPDIYVPYVAQVLDEYGYEGNPLVVPEVRKDAVTASYCLYAFGAHNAVCYSPFGIEELDLAPEDVEKPPAEVMAALNIDPSAFDIGGSREYLAGTYELIEQLKPMYLKYRGSSHLKCYVRKTETDYGTLFRFGEYDLQVAYAPKMPEKPLAAGIIIELESNKFLLAGMMSRFIFLPKPGEDRKAEYLSLEEGCFVNGEWKTERILNGDEKMMLKSGDMPGCFMVELFKY